MSAVVIDPDEVLPGAAATPVTGVAGADLTAGMAIYVDGADDDLIKPSRANNATTAICNGIMVNTAATGQPCHYQTTGPITLGVGNLTQGQAYAVSDAVAGEIVPYADLASGDYVTLLGVAQDGDILDMDIQNSNTTKP